MKRGENFARILAAVVCVGIIAVPLLTRIISGDVIEVHARVAEDGGWSPDVIQAQVGESLRMRMTSDDVVHGFAVGQMSGTEVDVMPGEISKLSILFEEPGTYTFYCTRWCGLSHWRMRGTIEVQGRTANETESATSPLYVQLGIDLDAPHPAAELPAQTPSAVEAAMVSESLPKAYLEPASYRAHSPAEVFSQLRAEPGMASLTDEQVWDSVAYVWQANTSLDSLAEGKALYEANCAACHGQDGGGVGVFADELAAAGEASMQSMEGTHEMSMQEPADFTRAEQILGASPALLHGKILRGGMGTGMPMWGTIFTDEQLWNVVEYLYTFQFDLEP